MITKIVIITIVAWSLIVFVIAMGMITRNIKSIAASRRDLRKKIKGLSGDVLKRKSSFFNGKYYFTLKQIQDNPNLIDFFSWDDLSQFKEDSLFSNRKDTPENSFHRKLFEIPKEALQRNFKLSSGKEFKLVDFKGKPHLFENFSRADITKFSPDGGLFKPRGELLKLDDFRGEERRDQPLTKAV